MTKTTNPITGLINVTGEPDTGKTLFALTSGASPERTVFVDDDVKGRSTVQDLLASGHSFGQYHNLVKLGEGKRELDFHRLCLDIIKSITPGAYDVLVWDTWTRFENTFQPVVANEPQRFKQFYSAMGTIKGAEQWIASFDYEAQVLADLLDRVPLVILTSHIKKDKDRVRDMAESKKPLVQKSRMRVWLRHNPTSPQPVGLILKRLAKATVTPNGIEAVSVTPRKMNPCTWGEILRYWNEPIGNRPPTEAETPNASDLSILDGVYTQDQKEALRLAVIDAEREREEEKALASQPETPPAWVERARELKAEGKGPAAIAREVGATPGEVAKWVK